MEMLGSAFLGAEDARPFEKQTEVLTFTTEPLTEPVEWTGRVRAELYVFWTAKDSSDSVAGISDRLRAKGDEASDASKLKHSDLGT